MTHTLHGLINFNSFSISFQIICYLMIFILPHFNTDVKSITKKRALYSLHPVFPYFSTYKEPKVVTFYNFWLFFISFLPYQQMYINYVISEALCTGRYFRGTLYSCLSPECFNVYLWQNCTLSLFFHLLLPHFHKIYFCLLFKMIFFGWCVYVLFYLLSGCAKIPSKFYTLYM